MKNKIIKIVIFLIIIIGAVLLYINKKFTVELIINANNTEIEQIVKIKRGKTANIELNIDHENYILEDIELCETASYIDGIFTLDNIREKIVCIINLKPKNVNVKLNLVNAKIEGEQEISVLNGENATFKINYEGTKAIGSSSCENVDYNFDTKELTISNVTNHLNCDITFSDAYKVSFNSNGGSSVSPLYIVKNNKASKPKDPVLSGYKFVGWYYNNIEFNFDNRITKDMTLTAKWEKITTVTFNFKRESKDQIINSYIKPKTAHSELGGSIEIDVKDLSYINLKKVVCSNTNGYKRSEVNDQTIKLVNSYYDNTCTVYYDCDVDTKRAGTIDIDYDDLLCINSSDDGGYFIYFDKENYRNQEYLNNIYKLIQKYNPTDDPYHYQIYHMYSDLEDSKEYIQNTYKIGNNTYYLGFYTKGNILKSHITGNMIENKLNDFYSSLDLE